MIRKFGQFNESVNMGDLVNNRKMIIIDSFDPENDGYIEYIAYGVYDSKFYFLNTDLEIIGEYDDMKSLLDDNSIVSDINYNEIINKL